MSDSRNDQQGESEEKNCITYYISDPSDDEEYELENIVESSDSEKVYIVDFYSKWQSQPRTSMEICEYEDDYKRVGLRSESPQSEVTDSESSDDDGTPIVDMIKRKVEEFNKKKEEQEALFQSGETNSK